MSHKRLTIFLGVLLALLIVPTTLPYILGHLILPWWAFVFYAIIILVNAGIYLLNEYRSCSNNYIRAYNHKIIPILLTVASTILGLLPFLIDGPSEDFWFSFAVGSISGLIFSVVALVFVMPMLMKSDKRMSVDRVVKNDAPLQVE